MRIANCSLSVDGVPVSTTNPSMGDDIVFDGIFLGHIVNYSIQLVFSGTPEGTLYLEGSNDRGSEDKGNGGWNDAGVANWTPVDGSSQGIVASGTHVWDVQNCGYRWVRAAYTQIGSTGSVTSAIFNGKGI